MVTILAEHFLFPFRCLWFFIKNHFRLSTKLECQLSSYTNVIDMQSLEFVVMDTVKAHPMPLFTYWMLKEHNRFKTKLIMSNTRNCFCIYSKLSNRNISAWNGTCNKYIGAKRERQLWTDTCNKNIPRASFTPQRMSALYPAYYSYSDIPKKIRDTYLSETM